jgi:Icc-related predicted phosphoesterase
MAVYVVADLHGAAAALTKAVPEDATLVLLGDLINVVDYFEMSGILVDIFSPEAVKKVVDLRASGELEEARRVMRQRSLGREEEIRAEFGRLALAQYTEVFSVLPDPTHLILGNVDIPAMAGDFVESHDGVTHPDGQVVDIAGERFGFAGGALPTPLNVSGEISEEEMRAKILALGDCDVLCTHIPPDVPELCFDTLAKRHEQGSKNILEYIQDVQPLRHYFGHVHQPLVAQTYIGRTLCINVGYFRKTQRAWPHGALG